MTSRGTIGLFGIGLDTYWPQFNGLRERLLGYQDFIAQRLSSMNVEVVNAGLVDTPDKARAAARLFLERGVEAIFLYVSTYALSHTVLPVAQAARVPIIVLNLQPVPAIDYEKFNSLGDRGVMTGEWLAHCQACSAPEIANVFNNCGIDYHLVTGWLKEDYAWDQISSWVDAAVVRAQIRDTRIGILGHYYEGMLDVYTDVTRLADVFGSHFELLEMDLLAKYRDQVSPAGYPAQDHPVRKRVPGLSRVRKSGARARGAHLLRAGPLDCRRAARRNGLLL